MLAQTLDSLDQAIFENENPFTESQGEVAEATSSSEIAQGEQTGSENPPGEFSGETNELPGEPIPGTGTRYWWIWTTEWLWPLQLRPWRLHCNLFNSQPKHTPKPWLNKRTKIIMSDAQGNQMNSSDGEYQTSPVAEVGNLPDFDQTEEDEDDWGKLPPKLAKDLLKPNVKGYLKITEIRYKRTFKQWQIKQEPPKNDGELSD